MEITINRSTINSSLQTNIKCEISYYTPKSKERKRLNLLGGPQGSNLPHTCPHVGIESKQDVRLLSVTGVFPQAHEFSTSGDRKQGPQEFSWHNFEQLCLPQLSMRSHLAPQLDFCTFVPQVTSVTFFPQKHSAA